MSAHEITCCRLLTSTTTGLNLDHLLNLMIVTDYYDGPISGFLRCEVCDTAYYFATVAWGKNHFSRVIALSTLPEGSWEKLVSFFGQPLINQLWIPPMLSRPSETVLDRIEVFLNSITSLTFETNLLLAWDVASRKVLSARQVNGLPSPSEINMLAPCGPSANEIANWLADLEITLGN